MKKIATLLLILIILVVALGFARNLIGQTLVVRGVKAMTGVELSLGKLDVGLTKHFVSLESLKILNPPNFTEKFMADFPVIYADYNLGDILKGKVHFAEIRINLQEFAVVKNQNGEININSLKSLAPKAGEKQSQKAPSQAAPQIQIDNLALTISKVVYTDYSSGKPEKKEFNLNLDERFKDITDPNALVNLIVVKALSRTTIASLANINLDQIKGDISGVLSNQAGTAVQKLQEKASETLMKTEGALQKIIPGMK
jgi:hypothetical protein